MSAGPSDHGNLRGEAPTTYYDGGVRLPGYGDAPSRCRSLSPVGFCESGHTVLGRSSCGTRYCPDHWRDWIEDAVINMVAQLAAYRQAQEMGPEKRLVHVVPSPPQDRRYSERALYEARTDAYDAARAAGVRGGSVVTHPYRTNDRGDDLYRMAKEAGDLDEDTGKWKFLREATEDFEDLSRYIEGSPHFHILGAAEDVDGEAAPEGWVVKRVRTFDTFHPRDTDCYRDMAATAYYVLTHGAAVDGRATTTYFGEVSAFNPEEELTAAMWGRIQKEAEKAVKATPEEEPEEGAGSGHEECPHEECEAPVRPLAHLRDRLEDGDWAESLKWERRARLRGALVWYSGRSDRPPPSKATDRESLRRWLRELGEAYVPRPGEPRGPQPTARQAQLPTGIYE
jgi:hypothetical protein